MESAGRPVSRRGHETLEEGETVARSATHSSDSSQEWPPAPRPPVGQEARGRLQILDPHQDTGKISRHLQSDELRGPLAPRHRVSHRRRAALNPATACAHGSALSGELLYLGVSGMGLEGPR